MTTHMPLFHKPMRLIAAAGVCAIAGLAPTSALGQTTLVDKMAIFNYLVGSWKCVVTVPATGDQPAKTLTSTETYDAVLGNVLHVSSFNATGASNDFYGYDQPPRTIGIARQIAWEESSTHGRPTV
jgi:hypothetical protein